jgi:hypothetical protein
VGDWKYENGAWTYDSGAPDADPTVTSMLPVYAAGDAEPVITAGSPADDTSPGPLDLIDCTCMPPEDEHQHGGTG